MEHKVAGVSTSVAMGTGGDIITLTVIACVCGQMYEATSERQRDQASEAMQQHIGARGGT